ncbi:membrane protein required for colicin V production [Pontibacter ummariensis]|uniref:Membrane protein required for colicin V production n=1 Tax=Pontibacter ummariensis TaxID=1610492 RepID=A0A239K927_9BACT|nr:CvpA family protein [Pontibacter ummariensis]PRY06031.1 membrane protein required for colicin V production [Pontibacter ummariensis]SNT14109.1 membrane protein required for colicin V production [Pontibacter ummariensis]
MSTFDIFLALPILYGAFQGFRKGLLLELVSLVALVLAILGGLKLLDSTLPVMEGFIGDAHGLLPYVTFLVVFVGIILLIHLGGLILKKVIDFTPFGLFDNVLGSILGALKWCVALSLLLYVSEMAGISVSVETASASIVYPVVLKTTPYALDILGYVLPFVKALITSVQRHF